MSIAEYIASGILESYALGEVTDEERKKIEDALTHSPELQLELQKIEETLEKLAQLSALPPRQELRSKILHEVRGHRQAKAVLLIPDKPVLRYAAAASIIVALLTSYMAYYYRDQWKETSMVLEQVLAQNQQMARDYNVVNEKLDKIQDDFAVIGSNAFTKVVMKGTLNDKDALASVYWNASSKEVFLSVQQLKVISKENQFQLWAIVNGKPVDVGVFDLDFAGLLRMKSVDNASAFAVTVEPRGGNSNPTLEKMQVIGSVTNNPS